ncbi:MAG: cysteine synthase family protein [Alphaproteobacteria bacterium]|nr:cysteine synthase family protein [Alphaproteobacteria bacterium]MCB9792168.1 cysteine synthase family protein [Alphaproteobacteria bacterium]
MSRPGLLRAIGDTPLVELPRLSPKPGVRIFAKLEGQNPSGSVKDRVALAMIEQAEATRGLKPGGIIVEASTGNTAIALAMLAKQKGYRLIVVVPEGVVPSIADILALYDVELRWTAPRAGMGGAIEASLRIAEELGGVAMRQFDNPVNPKVHFETTGPEILRELDQVDVFVAGIGTGGTLMGVGCRLLEANPEVKLIGVEPRMGERLQGLRSLEEGYHPPLLELDVLSGRYLVSADKALRAMREVVRHEGILAGVSSGATLYAARRVAEKMTEGNIVVMFSDGGWKYLPARPWGAAEAADPCLDETHWW